MGSAENSGTDSPASMKEFLGEAARHPINSAVNIAIGAYGVWMVSHGIDYFQRYYAAKQTKEIDEYGDQEIR